MEKMVKRIYKEYGVFAVLFALIFLMLFSTLIPVLYEPNSLWLISLNLFYIIIFIIQFATGYYSPIHILNDGIKYRRLFIAWEELEIVLVPAKRWPFVKPIYCMVFCEREMNYEELKKLILIKGRWVYLFDRNINSILPYYDKPFKVLDYNGRHDCIEGEIASRRAKLNSIVNDHNAKFKN